MIGFGCGTVWLNKCTCYDGRPPLFTLKGDQLIKREVEYCYPEDTIIDLEEGIKLGSRSKRRIGKIKMKHLGVNPVKSLGILSNSHSEIYRKPLILGEVEEKVFGQKEFKQIGIINSNSKPPMAIIITPSKQDVERVKNYWEQTLASDLYKKITKVLKKYFKDPKDNMKK